MARRMVIKRIIEDSYERDDELDADKAAALIDWALFPPQPPRCDYRVQAFAGVGPLLFCWGVRGHEGEHSL